jgi:hypothetical protein
VLKKTPARRLAPTSKRAKRNRLRGQERAATWQTIVNRLRELPLEDLGVRLKREDPLDDNEVAFDTELMRVFFDYFGLNPTKAISRCTCVHLRTSVNREPCGRLLSRCKPTPSHGRVAAHRYRRRVAAEAAALGQPCAQYLGAKITSPIPSRVVAVRQAWREPRLTVLPV